MNKYLRILASEGPLDIVEGLGRIGRTGFTHSHRPLGLVLRTGCPIPIPPYALPPPVCGSSDESNEVDVDAGGDGEMVPSASYGHSSPDLPLALKARCHTHHTPPTPTLTLTLSQDAGARRTPPPQNASAHHFFWTNAKRKLYITASQLSLQAHSYRIQPPASAQEMSKRTTHTHTHGAGAIPLKRKRTSIFLERCMSQRHSSRCKPIPARVQSPASAQARAVVCAR
eukprot:scaffold4811_cov104-Isochrysis_galbana.AAC.1